LSLSGFLAFLAAAALGAVARYLLDGFVRVRTGGPFPWGTLAVNLSGCLVLGVLTGLGLHHGLGPTARTAVGTGGVGAYTTFSTFTFETVRLVEEGDRRQALGYLAATSLLGLAAAATGLALTELF
jgi:CrcB protein